MTKHPLFLNILFSLLNKMYSVLHPGEVMYFIHMCVKVLEDNPVSF